jgi:adenine-specific DNA-methyltransferase
MSKFDDLVKKLREIFQIDRPDLDFGIYRVINQRAGLINDYLQNKLKAKVAEALTSSCHADLSDAERELKEAVKNAESLGMNPEETPKVKALKERVQKLSDGSSSQENTVFSHLLTFFSRYYDNGDFISQRRFKGDTYAIPYAGEEVVLHWANKDQYYTKSGENFSNYTFKTDDGRKVHFRLVAADTAKDNLKDNDKDRRFQLVEEHTVTRTDEDGEEYEETIKPIEEVGNGKEAELVIRFEYVLVPKGTKQAELDKKAIGTIFSNQAVKSRWLYLGQSAPTESDPKRTILEKHLTTYTEKNSADYFIHKNLKGFLRRELDFYIKNEVMNLDDVQAARAMADIEKNLHMIQCLRSIALDLIDFLSQIENFQKKLWLKKKFVTEVNYCITLDRVPAELYPEIAKNEAQIDEWIKLFAIDKIEQSTIAPGFSKPLTVDFLKANDKLVLDTKFFDAGFKAKLLGSIDNFDERCDGLLIHSENSSALRLIDTRYCDAVDGIYIDPPYNTNEGSFIYKNNYKHSCWGSMIQNSLAVGRKMLTDNGVISTAIDDFEQPFLSSIFDNVMGFENRLGTLVVEIKPSGRTNDNFFATSHEYLLFYGKNARSVNICFFQLNDAQKKQYGESDIISAYKWRDFLRTGGYSTPQERPNSFYPIYYNPNTGAITLNETVGYHKIIPVDSDGKLRVWRKTPASFLEHLNKHEINVIKNKTGEYKVQIIDRIKCGIRPKSVWVGKEFDASSHGTKLLKDIFGDSATFSFPKSIYAVEKSIYVTTGNPDDEHIILDYFAGSGTTGHAVINLNRNDDATRKYILIEMGDYFDTVLKPRIEKVVYSPDWKSGKPISRDKGISQCFKYLTLESYEDALNNIELSTVDTELFNKQTSEDYLLHYMMDVESKGSLLSVDAFKKPFDYKLKIAVDSAGATEWRNVDLVETFNYLIGIKVKHTDANLARGYITIEGRLPTGEKTLVIWRDCEKVGYEKLDEICKKLSINPKDCEYDVVYINGDHNIPSVVQETENEGGITRELKLRQIEPEFLKRMFEVEDV